VTAPDTPAMSVVLATDVFDTIREVLGHLAGQTIVREMEIVLVVADADAFRVDELALAAFHSWQVVEAGQMDLVHVARASGARAARAPVVFFAETHCFPEPESLAKLLERHREPWTVVGQVICNGNPTTATSWAGMLMDYTAELEGVPGGPAAHLPSHNSSYKRQALLDLGDELGHIMETGDVLNHVLMDRGGTLYLEPASRTHHLNVSRRGAWFGERYHAGRGFAGRRAEDWSLGRRLGYALAWPLIPLVRLSRIMGAVRHAGLLQTLSLRVYPTLLLGLVIASFGECVGYLAGPGRGLEVVSAMELHRRPWLRDGDPTYPDLP